MDAFLLIRYYRNEVSDSEKKEVEAWLNESSSNKDQYIQQVRIWESASNASIFDKIDKDADLHRIKNSENIPMIKFTGIKRWVSVAASIILLVGMTFLIYQNLNYSKETRDTIIVTCEKGTGSKEVKLPDGSMVYLKSPSQLSYLKAFTDSIREVHLDGSAFFDVQKNKDAFVVKMNDAYVRVLGTSFMIDEKKDRLQVNVQTGSVEVGKHQDPENAVFLEPGENVVLKNGKLLPGISNDANLLSWKTGIFVFDDSPLMDVFENLNEYYSKPILVDTKFNSPCNLTATFDNEPQEIILKTIMFTCDLDMIDHGTHFEFKTSK